MMVTQLRITIRSIRPTARTSGPDERDRAASVLLAVADHADRHGPCKTRSGRRPRCSASRCRGNDVNNNAVSGTVTSITITQTPANQSPTGVATNTVTLNLDSGGALPLQNVTSTHAAARRAGHGNHHDPGATTTARQPRPAPRRHKRRPVRRRQTRSSERVGGKTRRSRRPCPEAQGNPLAWPHR